MALYKLVWEAMHALIRPHKSDHVLSMEKKTGIYIKFFVWCIEEYRNKLSIRNDTEITVEPTSRVSLMLRGLM